jgi:transposase InsO family protein
VEERIALFRDYETGVFTVSELCRRHGISRETFYVWKRRRESGNPRWFEELSHAAANCPHATSDWVADRVIAVRRRFSHFGPKKIKAWLEHDSPKVNWPAASTIGDILKREGLVEPRRRRRRAIAQGEVVSPATVANEEWSIDFKGWFRTADGTRCDPLTLTDAASRYLVDVRIVEPTLAGVRGAMERVFAEVGLPLGIRSDNGAPFGSTGAGGLSVLSVWWLKLGIEPRYIPPSSPQDNGRHERMHRTLKEQTSKPAAATPAEQQRGSIASAATTMRSGRMKPSSRRRLRHIGSHRPVLCRRAWRIPGTMLIIKSAACTGTVQSGGAVRRCLSAKRWQASS